MRSSNYGHYLDELLDTVKAECRFRKHEDETLESAHRALKIACHEHRALLRWGDFIRSKGDKTSDVLMRRAVEATMDVAREAAELLQEEYV